MGLLQDIQNAAVAADCPISTLLRKCALLAARLKHEELKTWVSHELNGYPDDAELPSYRVLGAAAHGHLAGPFGSGYQNIVIPPMILPDWGKKYAEEIHARQPIAELESVAASGDGHGTLIVHWPGNLLAYMQTKKGNKFANGLVLYGAWQTLSKAQVVGLVDTVRNRVLEFALKLADEAPDAGEPDKPGSEVQRPRSRTCFRRSSTATSSAMSRPATTQFRTSTPSRFNPAT